MNFFIATLLIFITSCNQSINLDQLADSKTLAPPSELALGEEWVLVPANAGGMGLPAFYVMKYEAKAMLNNESASSATGTDATPATHKPVSTADHQPWRSIDANDAAAECESLGPGYHLVSNSEWMAISRDIENQDANWTGGSVGSGCLFRGNSGEATTGNGTGFSDSCGYTAITNPESGSGRDLRSKHTLSNGVEIFDIAGNISEWVDWDSSQNGFQSGPSTCSTGWVELGSFSCPDMAIDTYNSFNGTYDSSHGTGQIYGATLYSGQDTGAVSRGGSYTSDLYSGIYSLYMYLLQDFTNSRLGFRCVYRGN